MSTSETQPAAAPTPPQPPPATPPAPPPAAAEPVAPPPPLPAHLTLGVIVESLLKHPARIVPALRTEQRRDVVRYEVRAALYCLLAFGVTVGTFSWGSQLWVAPVKIALGALFSAFLCLPSLYIFTCLSGSDARLEDIVGILCGTLAIAALLLLGFAPVTFIFAQSTGAIAFMGALNLVFWFIGVHYGLRFMRLAFRQLGGASLKHITLWSLIFLFVTLQMTTTLRPIIGRGEHFFEAEKKFFLTHWIDCLGEGAGARKAPRPAAHAN